MPQTNLFRAFHQSSRKKKGIQKIEKFNLDRPIERSRSKFYLYLRESDVLELILLLTLNLLSQETKKTSENRQKRKTGAEEADKVEVAYLVWS